MKNSFICFLELLGVCLSTTGYTQNLTGPKSQAIIALVDQYSQARETKDTVLLKRILTPEISQLVSTGEWRDGMQGAVAGMLRSSATNPGTRTLTVEKIMYLTPKSAVADARYVIENPDGSPRKMWSTFIVVKEKGKWQIAAIRNMLPTAQ